MLVAAEGSAFGVVFFCKALHLFFDASVIKYLKGLTLLIVCHSPAGEIVVIYSVFSCVVLFPNVEMPFGVNEEVAVAFGTFKAAAVNQKLTFYIEKQADCA